MGYHMIFEIEGSKEEGERGGNYLRQPISQRRWKLRPRLVGLDWIKEGKVVRYKQIQYIYLLICSDGPGFLPLKFSLGHLDNYTV